MGDRNATTPTPFSRRAFLELTAVGGGATLMVHSTLGRAAGVLGDVGPGDAVLASVRNGAVTLARPDDQLFVQFVFLNLELVDDQLVAIDAAAPSAVKIVLPGQYVSQGSIDLDTDPVPDAGDTVDHRGADETRIVTTVEPPIAFTVDALLDLADRSLELDPRATGGSGSGAVSPDHTAIHLPTDVTLSPTSSLARFDAPTQAVTRGAVTELWKMRLGKIPSEQAPVFIEASTDFPVELRAPDGGDDADAFERALRQSLRSELVDATTDYGSVDYPENEPLLASRLELSIHGAWAGIAGSWIGRGALASYAEAVVSGRAVDITVIERGFLAPFGHNASVVEMRERQFVTAADGSMSAVLVESEAFIVEASTVSFPNDFMPFEARDFPFTDITLVAPTGPVERGAIAWTDEDGVDRSIDPNVIFELVDDDGARIDVTHVATATDGTEVSFATPAMFVPFDQAYDLSSSGDLQTLVDYWSDGSIASLYVRYVDLGDGVLLQLAEEAEPGSGATTKNLTGMHLNLRRPVGTSEAELEELAQPAFVPYLALLQFEDPSLGQATGGAVPSFQGEFHPNYLDFGTAPGPPEDRPSGHGNPRNEYVALTQPERVDIVSDGGGVVSPSVEVQVVGQDNGVSVDLDATGGVWDPADALGDATLLGVIPLKEMLNAITPSGNPADVPGIPAFDISFEGPSGAPDTLCLSFDWEPEVKTWEFAGDAVLIVRDDLATYGLDDPFDGPTRARFEFQRCIELDGSGSTDELEIVVENVGLQVPPGLPALALQLSELGVVQRPVTGTDYLFQIEGFQFVGILELLEPFRSFLGNNPAGGLDLDFLDDRVGIDVGFAAPDVNLGQVRISNISAGVTAKVPLSKGTPFSAGFYVGRAIDPVKIGVWIFNGFGSFEIDIAPPPDGIQFLEASIGIGAEIAASGLGVSGSVSMDVAAFITYDKNASAAKQIAIGGVFSLAGEVKAWGVLGAAVEGTLSLTYFLNSKVLQAKGKVTGSVTVVVTKDWSVEVEEEFSMGDSGSTPFSSTRTRRRQLAAAGAPGYSFVDAFEDQDVWAAYCDAFD